MTALVKGLRKSKPLTRSKKNPKGTEITGTWNVRTIGSSVEGFDKAYELAKVSQMVELSLWLKLKLILYKIYDCLGRIVYSMLTLFLK